MSDELRPCGCKKGGRHRANCPGPREPYKKHRDRYPMIQVYVGPEHLSRLKEEAAKEGVTPAKILLRAWLAQSPKRDDM